MLNEDLIEIRDKEKSIQIFSKNDVFVSIDFKKFNEILKNHAKITFYKEFLIKKSEKFLEIELEEDETFLNKLINIVENTEIIRISELIDKQVSILIVKKATDFINDHYEKFFNVLNEYRIFVDEINITIPEESEILSSIDNFILKSDFVLFLYEKFLEKKIKKYLKDIGFIKKTGDLILLKRLNKKIFIIPIEDFNSKKDTLIKDILIED